MSSLQPVMSELARIRAEQKLARDLIALQPENRGALQWLEDLVTEEVLLIAECFTPVTMNEKTQTSVITWEKCPGCTSRIRAADGVILYPHGRIDCLLSNAYSTATSEAERQTIAALMQCKTDRDTGQVSVFMSPDDAIKIAECFTPEPKE